LNKKVLYAWKYPKADPVMELKLNNLLNHNPWLTLGFSNQTIISKLQTIERVYR
jgi:hypothetical protein